MQPFVLLFYAIDLRTLLMPDTSAPKALLIMDDIAFAAEIRDSVIDIGWKVVPLIDMIEMGAVPNLNEYTLVLVSADMAADSSTKVFPVLQKNKCQVPILFLMDSEEHHVTFASDQATKAGFKIAGRLPTSAGVERIKSAFKANTPK